MRKKRTIRLKDPKLRKVRYELRTLLVREADNRIISKVKEKGDLRRSTEFSFEKYDELYQQEIKLRKLLEASIYVCPVCRDREKDHIFNPNNQRWYCEKCYEILNN